ncbi:MAG: TraM recognition domain-containing protein [Bdellovibrionaceae bacterium]|nr:TraM recognition domain-containing protein [Pseudobdellovibrionaceae bacterium]NUM59114.1 TraM recognition domain-containing protein [Pseudobdellovibrionaceae bacterium]
MDDKNSPSSNGETTFIAIIGLFLLVKILDSFWLWSNKSPRNLLIVMGLLIVIMIPFGRILWVKIKKKRDQNLFSKSITAKSEDSVFCGTTDKGEDIWIKTRQRAMHTQVIGTTNAGKTESVILPWAIQDIHSGKGLLLIDGKADNSLIDKLWAYTKQAGRENEFKLFSLSRREQSFQFNPLLGGTAEEITERVFNAFEFENPYYRSLQYEVMNQVMRVFETTQTVPTFQRLHQAISTPSLLEDMLPKIKDDNLKHWIMNFAKMAPKDREERTSGLLSAIGHFAFGENARLFNPEAGAITIDDALKNNQIVYFQLPVLLSPFLGKATGKLVLQSLQAAVANRHRLAGKEEKRFFSVFLDDFSEYLYEGFISILNKSRSANVGIVFAHQALGDITVLGDPVANSILTNANLKIFMRGNDPDSAEYFSKVIGTLTSTKTTERQTKSLFGVNKSGEMSARDVEEFAIHPNIFKRDLGVGEAIMIVPHERGSKTVRIKFNKTDDLEPVPIPEIAKTMMPLLEIKKNEVADNHVGTSISISQIAQSKEA